jgi:hypothetical protein
MARSQGGGISISLRRDRPLVGRDGGRGADDLGRKPHVGANGTLEKERRGAWLKLPLSATLAARPVYPTLLPTCRVAQLDSLGPLPDYRRTCEQRKLVERLLVGDRQRTWGKFQADASQACIVGVLY